MKAETVAQKYASKARFEAHNAHLEAQKNVAQEKQTPSPFAGVEVHQQLQTPDYTHYQVLEKLHKKKTDEGNAALNSLKQLLPKSAKKDLTHKNFDESGILDHRPTENEDEQKAFDKAFNNYTEARKAHGESESTLQSMKKYLEATCAFPGNPLETQAKGIWGWVEKNWNETNEAGEVPLISWGKAKAASAVGGMVIGIAVISQFVKSLFAGGGGNNSGGSGQVEAAYRKGQEDGARQVEDAITQRMGQQAQGAGALPPSGGLTASPTIDVSAQPA